jgi:Ca2+-binding EF-hand superfamily protein
MRTFHGVIDVNKDGIVSYDDLILLAERFATLGHLSENQEEELQDVLKVRKLHKIGHLTLHGADSVLIS